MISSDFLDKYSAQKAGNESSLGFVSNVDNFAVSTLVDVGTTLFNSVIAIPKLLGANTDEYRVETYDVLKSVNEDWAEYYNQSKDIVETASFIGGVLIPSGLAFKGMKLLQAGKLGYYPTALSDTAQAARISELQNLLQLGKKSTSEFRNLRWKLLAANAGQEMAQMAGMEVAVVASMNQHVWMEDYLKDPVTNFGISMMLGGVIGTSMGQIHIRKTLRDKLGDISTESMDKVTSKLIDIPLGISDVDKVQRYSINAGILKDIASDESQSPLTRAIASDFAIKWEGMAGKLEQTTVFGPVLKASKDKNVMEAARKIMLSDESFGANRVDLVVYDPKNFKKQMGVTMDLANRDAREMAETTYSKDQIIAGIIKDKADQLGYEIGGVSHLGPIVTSLTKTYLRHGEGEGYIKLLDVAHNAPEFSNFLTEVSTPGFVKALHEEIVAAIKETNDQLRRFQANKDLWQAGQAVRMSLTITEGLKRFKPEWSKLMKEDFTTYYSPYHKAWIPVDQLHNYSRAVDTGQTSWERVNVFKPNPDAFSEFAVREVPTATADRYWINTLGTVANAPLENRIYIMQGDLGVQNAWLSRLSQIKVDQEAAGRSVRLPEIHIVPESAGASTVAEMRKQGIKISLEDLEDRLVSSKHQQIKSLLSAGASMQEIGIRLNIPIATVERVLLEGKHLKEVGDWRIYTSAGLIDSVYLGQLERTLSFTTNGHRIASLSFRNADMSANLDAAKIKQQNRELMATIIAESNSDIVKQFYSVLNKDDKIWDIFEEQLSNIVNEKAGSFFFSSADFASRNMGDIGRIASIKGQEFFGIANSVSQDLLTNLSAKVRSATATQTGINEFNDVINLLQSTSGFRDIDPNTGTLFQLVETDPGVFIRKPIVWKDKNISDINVELSDAMREFLMEMRKVSRELWHMKNAMNKIQGFKELNDIGLWIPSFNPIGKFISYVIDTQAPEDGIRVKLLMGKSPEELASLEQTWKTKFGNDPKYKLVSKAQQEDYNFWQMRIDPTEMDFADISKFHSGASASAINIYDDSFASTIIENLHNRVIFYGRKMQEMYLDDIMSTLDTMSAANQKYFANQPTLLRAVGLSQREDAARSVKNMLLGNSNLSQYSTWQSVNNGFASMIEWTSRKGQELYKGLFEFDEKNRILKKSEFVRFSKEIEGLGWKNPFKDFNDYKMNIRATDDLVVSAEGDQGLNRLGFANKLDELRRQDLQRRLSVSHDSAEKIIAAGNSVLATLALRVMETGHSLVTAISWPIMMLPEFYRAMPKTYLGNALGEGVEVAFPARAIYDGIRFRHSDMAKPLIDRWVREGFGSSIVSEATRLNELITTGDKTAAGQINKIMNSDLIKKLSTPSDFAESESRLWILSIGYQLARRAYPGISEAGADMFAKEFMTRSVGNYYSAQRPAMFQGTLGVAIGLFQTYMLTWAQSAFRSIEERSFKALAAQMLAQTGLFGMGSLPLYDTFSRTIGEHFSDKHYDLQSGTYRALPDPLAEFLVYGLPASLGVGLYTRGDMQPRVPFVKDSPLDTIAAINATRQLVGATAHTLQKVYEANDLSDKFRGLLEGISMQSLSRPVARVMEAMPVPDGQGGFRAVGSVSREGNTIATSAEIWSVPGVLSRLVASRSTEEQVKREVDYLNSFYGSVDYATRKKATEALKTAIRGGNLTQEKLEEISARYLRTGTATGWKAALNEALATSEGGIDYKLGKRLRPDSPLQKMIDENY